MNKHLILNQYQINIIDHVKSLTPTIPRLWRFASYIPTAGTFAIGWTTENEVLVISHDGYSLHDPTDGKLILKDAGKGSYHLMSEDNLEFYLPERDVMCRIWGLYGGAGNCVASSGWKLQVLYPAWPNSVVGVQCPKELSKSNNKWDNIDLLKLYYIEYVDLSCGFSPDENNFMVGNGEGVEVFSRLEHEMQSDA